MYILEVKNLKKYYGEEPNIVRAINGINLKVEQGEFITIVGTSGSGKSTLLHMIGGLDVPTSGEIYISGKMLSRMNDNEITIFRRRNIGFIFQNYNLLPSLSVYENIVLPVELDGGEVDHIFLDEIIEMLSLKDKIDSIYFVVSNAISSRNGDGIFAFWRG